MFDIFFRDYTQKWVVLASNIENLEKKSREKKSLIYYGLAEGFEYHEPVV